MAVRSLTPLLHKVIQVVYLMLCLQRSVQKVQKRRLAVMRHAAGVMWALTDQSEEKGQVRLSAQPWDGGQFPNLT